MPSQTIGGQNYEMYSPEWYQAKDKYRVQQAGNEGLAQGTGSGTAATTYLNALKNAGYPLLDSASGQGTGGYGTNYPTTPVEGPGTLPTIQPPAPIDRIADRPTPANVGPIKDTDTAAANAAIFARAKDQVGQTTRGALTGLAGAMAGRGIMGSGVEGRGAASAVNAGQGQLGEVSRENAIKDAMMAHENALKNYEGDITQRGQTISSLDTRRGQDVSQRGQDVSAAQEAYNNLTNQRGQDAQLKGLEYTGKITQRGQNINHLDTYRNSQQQGLLDALSSFNRKY